MTNDLLVIERADLNTHFDGPGTGRIALLAMRWVKARDVRIIAARDKRRAQASPVLSDRYFVADAALTEARRAESRAKRLLLRECQAVMAREQSQVIDV